MRISTSVSSQNKLNNLSLVASACDLPPLPCDQEAKSGGSRRVQGQPGIHRKTLSQKKKRELKKWNYYVPMYENGKNETC
jgi:hypothetical protein